MAELLRDPLSTLPGVDLTYPPESDSFRKEIRAWLEENLPTGWLDEGFSMTAEERRDFNETWTEEALRRGMDLRRLARRVRRQGPHA